MITTRPREVPATGKSNSSASCKSFFPCARRWPTPHSRNVLHQDLKPENVMLGAYGETLVLDWGIAKIMGQPEDPASAGEAAYVQLPDAGKDTHETQAGSIMGSPSYMAPEVAAGLNHEVDYRSDVYLLGATLWPKSSPAGCRAARGPRFMRNHRAKAATPAPVPPRQVKPEVSRALNAICVKAMHGAIGKKIGIKPPPSLAEDVQRYLAGEPVSAYRESFLARAWGSLGQTTPPGPDANGGSGGAAWLHLALWLCQVLARSSNAASKTSARGRPVEEGRASTPRLEGVPPPGRRGAFPTPPSTDPVAEHSPYFDPARRWRLHSKSARPRRQLGATLEGTLPRWRKSGTRSRKSFTICSCCWPRQRKHVRGTTSRPRNAASPCWTKPPNCARRPKVTIASVAVRASGLATRSRLPRDLASGPKIREPPSPRWIISFYGEQYRHELVNQAGEPDGGESLAVRCAGADGEKAIEQYRSSLAIDPDHYWSHFQLGRGYARTWDGSPRRVGTLARNACCGGCGRRPRGDTVSTAASPWLS